MIRYWKRTWIVCTLLRRTKILELKLFLLASPKIKGLQWQLVQSKYASFSTLRRLVQYSYWVSPFQWRSSSSQFSSSTSWSASLQCVLPSFCCVSQVLCHETRRGNTFCWKDQMTVWEMNQPLFTDKWSNMRNEGKRKFSTYYPGSVRQFTPPSRDGGNSER